MGDWSRADSFVCFPFLPVNSTLHSDFSSLRGVGIPSCDATSTDASVAVLVSASSVKSGSPSNIWLVRLIRRCLELRELLFLIYADIILFYRAENATYSFSNITSNLTKLSTSIQKFTGVNLANTAIIIYTVLDENGHFAFLAPFGELWGNVQCSS